MIKRNSSSRASGLRNPPAVKLTLSEAPSELLRELVAHLRQNRTHAPFSMRSSVQLPEGNNR